MSSVEKAEKNQVRLTFEVTPERFQEGLKYSYNKNRGYVNISGFRKGKAPRKLIEQAYGKDFFYDDAINHVLPDAYEQALEENGVEPVYKPSIRVSEADEATGVVFVAEVYVKPEVEIDGYYGLTYPKADTEPNDSDIQAKLQAEREKNARVVSVDRPAENNDIVSINFTGYVDDVPFEGGEGKDYDLTLGSHHFIDDFEDQLVGHVAGDEVDVHVAFPENYGHKELSGKDALFKVEILEVKTKEYPEIDDEFAQDVSEFETLAEYRQNLADKIREDKEKKALLDKSSHVMQQLVGRAAMDVPEVMYTARVEEMLEDLRYRLSMQGMTLEMYLEFAQTTEAALKASYEKPAREDVNGMLALEAVAKKENMTISDEEFREQIEKMTENRDISVDDWMNRITPERKKEIMQNLLNQKALDFVLAQSIAVDSE